MDDIKDNPAILKKYILVPDQNSEYLVALRSASPTQYCMLSELPEKRIPQVFAVYRYNRGPFKDGDKGIAWEYEYVGVRVV